MAIEVFPDSPRISFSHDLPQNDAAVPVEQHTRSISSSSAAVDFDFCVFRESFNQEYSSADELFSDGKILPVEIKKRLSPRPPAAPPPLPPPPPPPQIQITVPNPESEEKQSYNKLSFWSFKRSTSLNCGSGYARTLCPLPLLSRSNSTGSTSSVKRSNNQKQNFVKYSFPNSSLKQSSSTNHQKPPLKKSSHGGVKVNPVLNIPSANLFRLGSIFSKDRSKKK